MDLSFSWGVTPTTRFTYALARAEVGLLQLDRYDARRVLFSACIPGEPPMVSRAVESVI